jgi:tetratricopeptide (TPR) repeat protein
MGRLTAGLLRNFRAWERPAQLALTIALILLAVTLITLIFGPFSLRQPALIGFFGLLVTMQAIFLWANRGMVTPYTQAQRHYLAEQFDAAREMLEARAAADQADYKELTLLGNTYRQLGLLDKSEQILTKAIALRPFDHFPLYGFGRTLLVMGLYARAAEVIERAIGAGAPPVVQFDLGEAYFRAGMTERAQATLLTARNSTQESHRIFMIEFLRYRLGESPLPSHELLQASLTYWQQQASRFQHTPYGRALAADLHDLQALYEEQ